MRLRVLDSGSRANGYLLYGEDESIAIECGVSYSEFMRSTGFKKRYIKGLLLSHEHGDHSRYLSQFLDAGINAYMSQGTFDSMNLERRYIGFGVSIVKPMQKYNVGGFDILPFPTQHDCSEPLGYLIRHKEMGTCLFATDTYYLRYSFNGLNHIMIECNYDNESLKKNVSSGEVPLFVAKRVCRSHMSLETLLSTLKSNDISEVRNIVLLHLSSTNSDSEYYISRVEQSTGIPTVVATHSLDIPLF